MKKCFVVLLFTLVLLPSFCRLYAQTPLYSDPLDDGSAPSLGILTNRNGQFISGKGWKATSVTSQLMITLPSGLPEQGTFTIDVTNFDPVSQNADVKQQIINLYSQANGSKDVFYNGGSWCNIRTGTGYTTGPGVAGFKFLASPDGIDARKEQRCMESSTWNLAATYEFKITWNTREISVYVDGQRQATLAFSGQAEPFRYIFLGTDNVYQGQAGPIYSNLCIYGSGVTPPPPPPPPASDVRFTDITASAGISSYSTFGYSHSATFADFNADGRSDLMIGNATVDALTPMQLFCNQDGQKFSDCTAVRGLDEPGMTTAMVNADFDLDGDLDLFQAQMIYAGIGFSGPNRLLMNNGAGAVQPLPNPGLVQSGNNTRGALAFDADGDGDLDLYCANWGQDNELYLNDGTGRMTRVFQGAEGAGASADYGELGVTAADIDNDGDIELYICRRPAAEQEAANLLFVNDGAGRFSEQATNRGVACPGRSHGAVFCDVDRDGDLDLFVVNYAEPDGRLPLLGVFFNDGSGHFVDRSAEFNIRVSGYHLIFADVDNDADPDLFLIRNRDKEPGAHAELYLNDGSGNFTLESGTGLEISGEDARGGASADFDRDGDVDFLIAFRQGSPVLLRNESDNDNHYLQFLARGCRGDYGGVGAKVTVFESGFLGDSDRILGYQQVVTNSGYLSQNDPVLHFGLARHTQCDVRVELTDGSVRDFPALAADQLFVMPAVPRLSVSLLHGDNQSGLIGSELRDPLVVRVRDQLQQPVAGVAITFTLVAGKGEFIGLTQVATNDQGLASVRFRFGQQAGRHLIQATMAGADSPVEFSATAVLPPPTAVAIGSGQTGTAGADLPLLVGVLVVDALFSPAEDYPVRFITTSHSSLIDGAKTSDKVTESDGRALAIWTLGTKSGRDSLFVVGQFSGPDTLVLTAQVSSSQAAQLRPLTAAPTDPKAPGFTFADPFAVKVEDGFGNPVAGHPVQFYIQAGGGNLNGAQQRTIVSDQAGQAQVIWTLGPYRGPEQILSAGSEINGTALENSPTLWRVVPERIPDCGHSTLNVASPVSADGLSTARLDVVLLDASGQNVGPGYRIRFDVSGSDNRIAFVDSLSDAEGRVTAFLSSTVAEEKSVRAWIVGMDLYLTASAVVRFEEAIQVPTAFNLISGNEQIGIVGKDLPSPLTVQVLGSNGAPLKDHLVVFRLLSHQGELSGTQSASMRTDQDGIASATLTLGCRAGEYNHRVQAFAANSSDTLLFIASALPDVPAQMMTVSGDSQRVEVSNPLPLPLVVRVCDRFENPCPQTPVAFSALDGGSILTSQPILTSNEGLAFCQVAAGTEEKQYLYEARLADGLGRQFFCFANAAVNQPPRILVFLPADSAMEVRAGESINFWLSVVDPDGDTFHIEWFLNGGLVAEGPYYNLMVADGLPALTQIEVRVSDANHAVFKRWKVVVQATAVELSDFRAQVQEFGNVELHWQIRNSTDISGFWLLRSTQISQGYERLHGQLLHACMAKDGYLFVDQSTALAGTTLYYRLEAVEHDGTVQVFGPIAVQITAPIHFVLQPNYPNPFNPTTTLSFSVPESQEIALCIYSIRGERIRTLACGQVQAGVHTLMWDACDNAGVQVPSGIYYAVLENSNLRQIIKMTLLK